MNDELHDTAEAAGRTALRATYDEALSDLRTAITDRDAALVAVKAERDSVTARATAAEAARDAALTEVTAAKLTIAERDAVIAQLRTSVAELEKKLAALQPPKVTQSRPEGDGYIAFEELGLPLDPSGALKAQWVGPKVKGKTITYPGVSMLLDGFKEGSGQFVAGIQINGDANPNAPRGVAGSIDIATGKPVTAFGMVPDSSQFRSASAAYQAGTSASGQKYSQSLQAVIRVFNVPNAELRNLVGLHADQPHFYHGFRIEGKAPNPVAANLDLRALAKGGGNMPPGETYALAVDGTGYLLEDITVDCGVEGKPYGSTAIGVLSSGGGLIRRLYTRDSTAGFGVVYWNTKGVHDVEGLKTERMGTGRGEWNGSAINFEGCEGTYNIRGLDVLMDNAWPNPLMSSGKRANPSSGVTPRHEGKWPHLIMLDGGFDPNRKVTVNVYDPVWRDGFGFKGAFGVWHETMPGLTVNVYRGGKKMTPVYRPQWWVEPSGFTDPQTQYQYGDDAAQSALGG